MNIINYIFFMFLGLLCLSFAYSRRLPRNPHLHHDRRSEEQGEELEVEVVRPQRQAGGYGGGGDQHDAVDFGAHTGDHGAFGWYADFPVHSH